MVVCDSLESLVMIVQELAEIAFYLAETLGLGDTLLEVRCVLNISTRIPKMAPLRKLKPISEDGTPMRQSIRPRR